jgi:hypothetical protein
LENELQVEVLGSVVIPSSGYYPGLVRVGADESSRVSWAKRYPETYDPESYSACNRIQEVLYKDSWPMLSLARTRFNHNESKLHEEYDSHRCEYPGARSAYLN